MKNTTKQISSNLYDAECKQILTNKQVIANIMIKCIPEYKGLSIEQAIKCIKYSDNSIFVKTLLSEDKSIPYATVFYDLLFETSIPSKSQEISMYINIEAQNDNSPGYSLLNRAIYYSSRILAGEKGKDFENYNKMKKIYSIWICTTPTKLKQDTINFYTIEEKNIKGNYKSNEDYKYINVIMLNIGNEYNYYDNKNDILEMLSLLFKKTSLESSEVSRLLNDNYGIMRPKEEVSKMCSLSQGIAYEARQEGIALGLTEGEIKGKALSIIEMLKNNISKDDAFKYTNADEEIKQKVEEILKEKK